MFPSSENKKTNDNMAMASNKLQKLLVDEVIYRWKRLWSSHVTKTEIEQEDEVTGDTKSTSVQGRDA